MMNRVRSFRWKPMLGIGMAAFLMWTGWWGAPDSLQASAETKIKVMIDGVELSDRDGRPINRDGRLLVPMRAIFEALGAEISWNQRTKTVEASKDGTEIRLAVGEHTATVDGVAHQLDVPALIAEGRTMVPLRFISVALQADVLWNQSLQTALIRSTEHDLTYRNAASDQEGTSASDPSFQQRVKEIKAEWAKRKPTFTGNPYAVNPVVKSPYETGTLKSAFIRDGVEMTNFVRYLAGLPSDLKTSDELNEQAQYGAVLLAAHGKLTHEPAKPANMTEAFYREGYEATTTSNIAYIAAISSQPLDWAYKEMKTDSDFSLASSVVNYMRDEDDMNIDRVGHRRWILNPELQEIGFGTAHRSAKTSKGYELHLYSAMKVFDQSRGEVVDFDAIRWPNEGAFPTAFFGSADPWSISLNPERYQAPSLESLKVELTRSTDGKKWTIDGNNPGNHYMTVNNDPYGIPYCLIFRPSGVPAYRSGETWSVAVSGLREADGSPAKLAYEVSFFDLE